MWCAACDAETPTRPCVACGGDPLVDGRYELEGVLGRGATATTWRARRLSDGLLVAAKEVSLRVRPPPKAMELLTREQRVLGELDHPALPRQLESFETGKGRTRSLWLVQTLIEGITLAEEARSRRYDEREVLAIVAELADILDYLHTRSPPIVHRDVKPGNVLRRPDGRLALVDFGSVRDVLKDPDLGGSTVTGTFGYMAPEQFAGDAVPATDLYALGALAVALLTRREPHTMLDGRELAWKGHATVSPRTAQLLDELLEEDVAKRPHDAAIVGSTARRLVRSDPAPHEVALSSDLAPSRVSGGGPSFVTWTHLSSLPERGFATAPQPPAIEPETFDPPDRWEDEPPESPRRMRHRLGVFLTLSFVFCSALSWTLAPPLAMLKAALAPAPAPAPIVPGDRLRRGYEMAGWRMAGEGADGYRVRTDPDVVHGDHETLLLEPRDPTTSWYGTWMREIDATPYLGERVRITAWTHTEDATGRADLWARAQGVYSPSEGSGQAGTFEDVLGANEAWTQHAIELDVPASATSIQYGVGLAGQGRLWLDAPTIEIVGPQTWTP